MITKHRPAATLTRRMPALAAAAAALFVSMSGTALAAVVTDQVSPVMGGGAVGINSPFSHFQQEVVVGVGGTLTAIDLVAFLRPGQPQDDFGFALYRGAGWHASSGSALLSSVVTPFAGTMSLDLSALGLMFSAGETFVFGLTGLSFNDCCLFRVNQGLYAPGRLFDRGSAFNFDLAFTTRMDTSAVPVPVPEPGSLALLVLALGLAGVVPRARRA